MKRFYQYCILGCLVAFCYACKDELTDGRENTNESSSVYMTFTVKMHEGGLSARSVTDDPDDNGYVTSNDGNEIGKDRENYISEVLLLFADEKETFIYAGTAPVTKVSSNQYNLNTQAEELENYSQSGNLQVYLFCNPDDKLKEAAEQLVAGTSISSLLDKSYTLSQEEKENSRAWEDNRFFMSNAIPHTVYFPGSITGFSKETPWDLGTIRVERSVARFDYRSKMPDNLYRVYDKTDGSEEYTRNPHVFIQLTDIALVNMSRSFYYWRRVSNTSDGFSNPIISGTETVSNYVVDTDALQKSGYITNGWTNKMDYFFYNLETPTDRHFTPLSSISANEEDEDESWNEDQTHNGYHIWRYASENTIPGIEQQQNGISTGVLLKATIKAEAGTELATVMNAKKTVYVFDKTLFGDWDAVRKAASAGGNQALKEAYDAVNAGKSHKEAGFTVYTPNAEDGNYYTYYYYWNRHNDNLNNNVMGPMEFAVVRNNVYKLQVDAIYGFGIPEESDSGDHEVPNPNNPDESDEDSDNPEPGPDDPGPDDPGPDDPGPDDPGPDDPGPDDPGPDDPGPGPDDPDINPDLKLTVKVLPWVTREFTITFD